MGNYKIPTESEIQSEISKAESQVSASNASTAQASNTLSASSSNTGSVDQVTEVCPADVYEVLEECDDLVTALESVGAMYRIPASHILCDANSHGIKVMNDCIVAPPSSNVMGNAKSIMCAIGAVLDNISQRVDDKLNNYQSNNIRDGKASEVRREANPAKGDVVGRYTDDNGDEIIVYNTGMVDMASTEEAFRKVDELRQDMKIPMYNPSAMRKQSYFSDSEDLANGVDMQAGDLEKPEDLSDKTVDVASDIQESAVHLDLISKFNNTTNLGYDLLQSQGFDYIKPVMTYVQESGDSSGKKKKNITADDIKYMKFDNTHILKAIKYFNKAREEQAINDRGKINKEALVQNENFVKGIDELSKQFDARIVLRIVPLKDESNAMTIPDFGEYKTRLYISKSKGFQLSGMPIDIFYVGSGVDDFSPDDNELFGQGIVSTCLHEIFHNIAAVLRENTASQMAALESTMMIASSIRDGKRKRIFLTNYVNTLSEVGGRKLPRVAKRILVKQLAVLSTAQLRDEDLRKVVESVSPSGNSSSAEDLIDEIIKFYEKTAKKVKRQYSYKKPVVLTILAAAALIAAIAVPVSRPVTAPMAGFIGINAIGNAMSVAALNSMLKTYGNSKKTEEFYCDMFAAMYNLPVTFFIDMIRSGETPGLTPNQVSVEKLKKLAKLEYDIHTHTFAKYPTMSERNWAGVKIAKSALENCKDLDPAFKKYMQWIVDNYSNMLDTDIAEIYNTATFDPKTAEDLDQHLNNLITQNNIALTESDVSWLIHNDGMMVCESYRPDLEEVVLQEGFVANAKNKILKALRSLLRSIKGLMMNMIQKIRKNRMNKGKSEYYISLFDPVVFETMLEASNDYLSKGVELFKKANECIRAIKNIQSNSDDELDRLISDLVDVVHDIADIEEDNHQSLKKFDDKVEKTLPKDGKSFKTFLITESEFNRIMELTKKSHSIIDDFTKNIDEYLAHLDDASFDLIEDEQKRKQYIESFSKFRKTAQAFHDRALDMFNLLWAAANSINNLTEQEKAKTQEEKEFAKLKKEQEKLNKELKKTGGGTLTNAFLEAVRSGDKLAIRIMMKSSLYMDPTFRVFEAMDRMASSSVPGLYVPYDNGPLKMDADEWTEDYMDKLLVRLVDNFSKERVAHLKKVIRYLYPSESK